MPRNISCVFANFLPPLGHPSCRGYYQSFPVSGTKERICRGYAAAAVTLLPYRTILLSEPQGKMPNGQYCVQIVDSTNTALPEYEHDPPDGYTTRGGSKKKMDRVWNGYGRIASTEGQQFGILIAVPEGIFRQTATGAMVSIRLDSSDTGEYWTLQDTRFVSKEQWEPKRGGHNGVKYVTIMESVVKTGPDVFEPVRTARKLTTREEAEQLSTVGNIVVEMQLGKMVPGESMRYFGRSRRTQAPWSIAADRTMTSTKNWQDEGLQHCVRLISLGECNAPEMLDDQSFRPLNGENGGTYTFNFVFRPQAIADKEGWRLKDGDRELPGIPFPRITPANQEPPGHAGPVADREDPSIRNREPKSRKPRTPRQPTFALRNQNQDEDGDDDSMNLEPEKSQSQKSKKRKAASAPTRTSKRILDRAAAHAVADRQDAPVSASDAMADDEIPRDDLQSVAAFPVDSNQVMPSQPAGNGTASGSANLAPLTTEASERPQVPSPPRGRDEEASHHSRHGPDLAGRVQNDRDSDIESIAESMAAQSIAEDVTLEQRVREWSKKVPIADARKIAQLEVEKERCVERQAFLKAKQAGLAARQAGLEAQYLEKRAQRKGNDLKRLLAELN
ncbi:uncharacterized protein BDZ99DRAFT_478784 [Mytilinidion resinicola]|uniref:DUF7918 domain-containing protein n=1 Tax=Mytilinidion resinicola TaxID=574789 RepID=A0A6A6YEM6_9PEZI|nr:uncharacterized protein BDZ99DRAFT_478784 [Mytilinidion resinicola]KAF2807282.1 hypothetical protein BDZ99DRAFT_478784 [Mytilinidion resinicola]